MRYLFFITSLLAFSIIQAQSLYIPDTLLLHNTSTNDKYGRTVKFPIKAGVNHDPTLIYRYLNNLADLNGNHVSYTRMGTETIDNKGTETVLTKYFVETRDMHDTLYFDSHSWEQPLLISKWSWKEKREGYYGEYANDSDTLGNGKGLFFYNDGSIYQGLFVNGKREGWGRLYYPSSSTINYAEGLFSDDKQKGKFKLVKKDGSISYLDY